MEEISRYRIALQDALEKYKSYLDKRDLPALKEHYQLFHMSFKALWEMLLKKGIIHPDPYKLDSKSSEIVVPSEDHFPDMEKTEKMSVRLSQLESQLDLLLNYYQFSSDFLDLNRVRLMLFLTKYINWDAFTETSANLNTKVLAEFVGRIRKGTDNLSTGIVIDSVDKIQKAARRCLATLKKLASYQRELYKLEVRLAVIPSVKLDQLHAADRKEETTKLIKKHFPAGLPGKHFYTELIHELIDEDYGPGSADRHAQILEAFVVKDEQPKHDSPPVSLSAMLLEAIRALSGCSRSLDEAAAKLSDNSLLLENRHLSLMERFQKWIMRYMRRRAEKLTYEVEYFDVTTASSKHERIEFMGFMDELRKKARLYSGIFGKMGTIYKKLETAGEDQLFAFLNKNLEEMSVVQRRMNGLDAFFKTEIPKEQRPLVRGIKIELTAIKNNVVKANQKKHEYVAKKEETEQMRKLGINLNVS